MFLCTKEILATDRFLDLQHKYFAITHLFVTKVRIFCNNIFGTFFKREPTVYNWLSRDTYTRKWESISESQVVQMYQWFESEDRRDSGNADHDGHMDLSYSYDTGWFDRLIDSESFNSPMGHHNPETWPINSTVSRRLCFMIRSMTFCKECYFIDFTFNYYITSFRLK